METNATKIVNFSPPLRYLSCSGWILCVSKVSANVSLTHSMLGINIKLPDIEPFPLISKMVLSGSPINDDALVMVIRGRNDELVFCRPADESWTLMDRWARPFYDIIYHNSKLYALDCSLTIVECDIHGSNPTKIVEVFNFPTDDRMNFDRRVIQGFLVESFGKFLMVLKYRSGTPSKKFWIIEIELNGGSYGKIDNMGNRCLFLGLNSSICVEFPSSVKLKANCIYYASAKLYSRGVYTLCDGCFEDYSGMLYCCCPPTVWVVPGI